MVCTVELSHKAKFHNMRLPIVTVKYRVFHQLKIQHFQVPRGGHNVPRGHPSRSADDHRGQVPRGAGQAGGRGPRHHSLLQEVHRPLEVIAVSLNSF